MIKHETILRVRYAETDAQGIVHHSVYFVWFELGRVELLRSRGTSYRDLEAQGYDIIVADVSARYRAPARFDDLVALHTMLTAVRSRTFAFSYEVRRGDGQLLVTGHSNHLVLERASGRPIRVPEAMLRMLSRDT